MKNILCFLLGLLSFIGCKIDNYAEPDLTVSGRIIDSETNTPIESGGSNGGTIVKFYQGNSAQALLFKTFPDGSFANSRVFAGSYRYVAEGPFQVATDTPTIAIKANTAIDIMTIPNVRLQASVVSKSGTTAVIKVEYEKVPAGQKLVKLGVVWSNVINPNVFTFTGGSIITEDVQSLNLTTGEKEFTISNLAPNTKYYIRASALTNAPGNYYNYSTQVELQE
jgi:hypothetical protein